MGDAALFLVSRLSRGDHGRGHPRGRRVPRDGDGGGCGLSRRPPAAPPACVVPLAAWLAPALARRTSRLPSARRPPAPRSAARRPPPRPPAPIQNVAPTPAPSRGRRPRAGARAVAHRRLRAADGDLHHAPDSSSASRTGTPSSAGSSTCVFGDTRIQADQLDLYEMPRPDGTVAAAHGRGGQRGVHARRGAALRREAGHAARHQPGHVRERARLRLARACSWRPGASSASDAEHLPDRGREVHLLHAAQPALELLRQLRHPGGGRQGQGHERALQGARTCPPSTSRTSSIRSRRTSAPRAPLPALRRLRPRAASTSGTGFFWAMGRSVDQTFYVDHYSKYGYGFGHEFRYMLAVARRAATSAPTSSAAPGRRAGTTTSTGTPSRCCPGKVRASLRVQESSTVDFQEQFQENLDLASRRSRVLDGSTCSAASGPLNFQLLGRLHRHLLLRARAAGTDLRPPAPPALAAVNQSPRKLEKHRARVRLRGPRGGASRSATRTASTATRATTSTRALSRPLSRSFLQLTPAGAGAATPATAAHVDRRRASSSATPIDRRYVEGSLEMRGPDLLARLQHARQLLLRPLQARHRARGHLHLPLEVRRVRLHPALRLPRLLPGHQRGPLRARPAALRQAARRAAASSSPTSS